MMSLPGRFMLVVAVAAVWGLMAAMMVRTLELRGGETFAKAEQNDVIEAHKSLPAGPRRFP
jgi:hypothetical protein